MEYCTESTLRRLNILATLLLLLSGYASAQAPALPASRTVRGSVLSDAGAPLQGGFIYVQGKERPKFVEDNGTFTIDLLMADTVLVGQAQGYITQERKLTVDDTVIVFTLQQAPPQVYNGLGLMPAKQNFAAIASIPGSSVSTYPTANVDAGLQGKLAGLQITQSSGLPLAAAVARLRGTGSVLAGSEPLYVVDGMPIITGSNGDGGGTVGSSYGANGSPLAWFNTLDIERIDMLKDASATAIYGARGANGVILITTQKGRPGRTRFTASYLQGVQTALGQNKRKQLDGTGLLAATDQAFANSFNHLPQNAGLPLPAQGTYLPYATGVDSILSPGLAAQTNTNYAKDLLRAATFQKADFSVSAGDNKLIFYTNLNYLRQTSVLKGGDLQRVSVRFNAENNAAGNLKIGISTLLNIGEEYISPAGEDTTAGFGQARRYGLSFVPYRYQQGYPQQPYVDNPYFNAFTSTNTQALQNRSLYINERKTFRNFGTVYAALGFAKYFNIRTEVGFDYYNNVNREYRSRLIRRSFSVSSAGDTILAPTAGASDFREAVINLSWNNTLSFSKKFGADHAVSAWAGTSLYRSNTKFNGLSAELFPNDYSPLASNASRQSGTPQGGQSAFIINGAFAKAAYTYKGQYYLDATIRGDRSSRFGDSYGTYISKAATLGWQLASEPFIDSLGAIQDLRLRLSAGSVGNAVFDNFLQKGYTRGGQPYVLLAFQGQYPLNLAAANLKPETQTTYNAGIDITTLSGRITLSLDAYNRRTTGLLQTFILPASAGYNDLRQAGNAGTIANRGLEATFSAEVVRTRDFSYSISLNSSYNSSKVVDPGPVRAGQEAAYGYARLAKGQTYGTFYLADYAGIADADDPARGIKKGDELIYGQDGQPFRPTTVGQIDSARHIQNGKSGLPTWQGGISNVIRYNGFDLTAYITWSLGQYILDYSEFFESYQRGRNNILQDATTSGANIYFSDGRAGIYNDPLSARPTTRFLHKGDYTRLKSLQVGYSLQAHALRSLRVQGARIFIQADNLLTVTPYQGQDSEFSANLQSPMARNLGQGVNNYAVPQLRSFLAGIQVTF